MKRSFIVSILLFSLMLTGCAKNVEPLNKPGKDKEIAFNKDFSYSTISEIITESDDIYNEDYNSISIAKGIRIKLPSSVVSMKIHECEANEELAQKLIDRFGNDLSTINDDGICLINQNKNGEGLYLDKSGTFIWYKNANVVDVINNSKENKIDLTYDYDDITISFNDGDIKLSHAVDLAKDIIADYCNIIGVDAYVPISARYCESGIVVFFTDSLNGYTVPDCYIGSDKGNVNSEMFSGVMKQCYVTITSCNGVTGISDQTGCAHVEQTTKEYNKIISLRSALMFLDNNISDRMKCKITGISMVQVHNARNKVKISSSDVDLEKVFGESNYETSPCWEFKMVSEGEGGGNYIALINCITGEFAFGKDLS